MTLISRRIINVITIFTHLISTIIFFENFFGCAGNSIIRNISIV